MRSTCRSIAEIGSSDERAGPEPLGTARASRYRERHRLGAGDRVRIIVADRRARRTELHLPAHRHRAPRRHRSWRWTSCVWIRRAAAAAAACQVLQRPVQEHRAAAAVPGQRWTKPMQRLGRSPAPARAASAIANRCGGAFVCEVAIPPSRTAGNPWSSAVKSLKIESMAPPAPSAEHWVPFGQALRRASVRWIPCAGRRACLAQADARRTGIQQIRR